MDKRFDPAMMEKLESPRRRAQLPPENVLDAMDLQPGMHMLDIGAGTGYFALPALRRLRPGGALTALDISPQMLKYLRQQLPEDTKEVLALCGDGQNIDLPDSSLDVALLALVFHEFDDPRAAVREVLRVLKPGGEMHILDWAKREMSQGPPLSHRYSGAQVQEFCREDFLLQRQKTFAENRFYMLSFSSTKEQGG
ncbi:MAG: class I SAM-dependent methyltransferase [Fibrobacterota bacterium]